MVDKIKPILTAVQGTNADLFPGALKLFTKTGARVLDMTWGKGTFWKKVNQSEYNLVRNDIDRERGDVHYDFRRTGFDVAEFDSVVLDPPYASRSSNKKSFVGSIYNNGNHHLDTVEDMIEFYRGGIMEAFRILKPKGILYLKCMDEISGGKQQRNHIALWKICLEVGFVDEDLFVLAQDRDPVMRHNHQLHARKNNSFLWVFRK